LLTFCDTLNIPLVEASYELLPEVMRAEPNYAWGDGDRVTLELDGDIYIYELSNGAGDCMAGCYCRQTWRFAIKPSG